MLHLTADLYITHLPFFQVQTKMCFTFEGIIPKKNNELPS